MEETSDVAWRRVSAEQRGKDKDNFSINIWDESSKKKKKGSQEVKRGDLPGDPEREIERW